MTALPDIADDFPLALLAPPDRAAFMGLPMSLLIPIMEAIEAREPFTRSQARNVAVYAVAIARRLRLPSSEIEAVRLGALLSNLGMLRVPERILQKTTALTAAEQDAIHQHPLHSAEMLAAIPRFKAVKSIVLHHHEDWGGGGYPTGIDGERIPLGARIVRLADTYDALTNARPYRPPYSPAKAMETIAGGVGQQFDPQVVVTFSACLSEWPQR